MAEKTVLPVKEAKAIVRYLRISPRKVRLVTDTIRRKPVSQAFAALTSLNKKAARLVEKGLKSAVANAKAKGLEESQLVVAEIKADGGPMMKRFMARAMGRADEILKRSTHLTILLREEERAFGPPPRAPETPAKEAKPIEESKKEGKAKQAKRPARRRKAQAAARKG